MAFVLAIGNILFKSKCKEFECCCVRIIRDVDVEERETEFITMHQPMNQPSHNPSHI
jgi:hypothetical protein